MQKHTYGNVQFPTPFREAKFCGVLSRVFHKLRCAAGENVCGTLTHCIRGSVRALLVYCHVSFGTAYQIKIIRKRRLDVCC